MDLKGRLARHFRPLDFLPKVVLLIVQPTLLSAKEESLNTLFQSPKCVKAWRGTRKAIVEHLLLQIAGIARPQVAVERQLPLQLMFVTALNGSIALITSLLISSSVECKVLQHRVQNRVSKVR